jgi:prepilin-type N-terminal cleavage/methylation domain-containing protein
MNIKKNSFRRGFALVELLAVVLILSVLAAIAIPLYVNSRKTSAARACTANLATIASAETAYKTRFGKFVGGTDWNAAYTAGATPTGGLIGAPEGLGSEPKCPLSGSAYTVTIAASGATAGNLTISCGNAGTHQTDTGAADTTPWNKSLVKGGDDQSNPL